MSKEEEWELVEYLISRGVKVNGSYSESEEAKPDEKDNEG